MRLMTNEIKNRFLELGRQDIPNPIIVAKWFTPWADWTWYGIAYELEDDICFGLVVGFETELGYFDLKELEDIRGPGGLRIERDLYWTERRLDKIHNALQPGSRL